MRKDHGARRFRVHCRHCCQQAMESKKMTHHNYQPDCFTSLSMLHPRILFLLLMEGEECFTTLWLAVSFACFCLPDIHNRGTDVACSFHHPVRCHAVSVFRLRVGGDMSYTSTVPPTSELTAAGHFAYIISGTSLFPLSWTHFPVKVEEKVLLQEGENSCQILILGCHCRVVDFSNSSGAGLLWWRTPQLSHPWTSRWNLPQ